MFAHERTTSHRAQFLQLYALWCAITRDAIRAARCLAGFIDGAYASASDDEP